MKRWYLLGMVWLALACGRREPARPPDALDRQQMAAILVDIHLLEARLNTTPMAADSSLLLYQHVEADILARHQTDSAQYARSFRYYTDHVGQLDRIYAEVLDTLGARESRAQQAENTATPGAEPGAEATPAE